MPCVYMLLALDNSKTKEITAAVYTGTLFIMLKFKLKFSLYTYTAISFSLSLETRFSLEIYFHLSYKSPFKKFGERREIKKCWIRDDITQTETFAAMLIIWWIYFTFIYT